VRCNAGAMEYWSIGVMEMMKAGLDFFPTLQHSNTPVLQKTF